MADQTWQEIALLLTVPCTEPDKETWRYAFRCRLCGHVAVGHYPKSDYFYHEFESKVLADYGEPFWVRCNNCGLDAVHDTVAMSPFPRPNNEEEETSAEDTR